MLTSSMGCEQRHLCPEHPTTGQKPCSFSWGVLVCIVQSIARKLGFCSESRVAIGGRDRRSFEMVKVAFLFFYLFIFKFLSWNPKIVVLCY